jgi:hypothetical protein
MSSTSKPSYFIYFTFHNEFDNVHSETFAEASLPLAGEFSSPDKRKRRPIV